MIRTTTRRSPWAALMVLLLFLFAATGCGPSFDVVTPDDMVELERDRHSYVAMTYDGVVVRGSVYAQGERADVPGAAHEFWVNATRERMRLRAGYALLDEQEVRSADGHLGTRLVFGRDQQDSPYVYWITLFTTEDHLHIIDAGGQKDRFEGVRDSVEALLASYEVR